MIDNRMIHVRYTVRVRQSRNADCGDVLVLDISNMLEVGRTPAAGADLKVLYKAFHFRVVTNITGIAVVGGNQGHETVGPGVRICCGVIWEQRAPRHIDCDFTNLATVRESCTHPVHGTGPANFNEHGNDGSAGDDHTGITGSNRYRNISVAAVDQVGFIRDRAAEVPLCQKIPPLHTGIPTIASIGQADVKVMIQGASLGNNAKGNAGNSATVTVSHATLR